MGSKNDGFRCDHLNSICCKAPVRFETSSDGYTTTAWCSECGKYCNTGRTEALIALKLGNLRGYAMNMGYLPHWYRKLMKGLNNMKYGKSGNEEMVRLIDDIIEFIKSDIFNTKLNPDDPNIKYLKSIG